MCDEFTVSDLSSLCVSVFLTALVVVAVAVFKCELELGSLRFQSHCQLFQLPEELCSRVHFQEKSDTSKSALSYSETDVRPSKAVCLSFLCRQKELNFNFGASSGIKRKRLLLLLLGF